MKQLEFSVAVDSDLFDILAYGTASFGEAASDSYCLGLYDAFEFLCERPLAGERERTDELISIVSPEFVSRVPGIRVPEFVSVSPEFVSPKFWVLIVGSPRRHTSGHHPALLRILESGVARALQHGCIRRRHLHHLLRRSRFANSACRRCFTFGTASVYPAARTDRDRSPCG